MVAWRLVNRGLGLISTLILARLLAPDDFGLVTLAFGVAATLTTSSAIGVEAQIVRSRTAARSLYDTAFTLNLLRGVFLGGAIFLLAAPAAGWFRDARLEVVLQVVSILPVLEGLKNVGMVEYQRQLRFDKDFWFLSLTRTFQVLITVSMAFVIRNYVAMLTGIVASRVFAVGLSYAMHPHRPRLSFAARHELLSVSLWTWLINVAVVVRDRSETFLIGRLMGVEAVGIYAVAVELAGLALTELVSPLAQACMPGFAATLRDAAGPAVGAAFRRALGVTAVIATPAGIGLSLIADPAVLVALGRKWAASGGLVAVMAVAFIPLSLGLIANSLIVAHAALRRLFLITAMVAVVRVLALLAVGSRYGLLGLAVASSVVSVTEQAVLLTAARRLVGLPLRTFIGTTWRPLAAATVMAVVLWQSGLGWAPTPEGLDAALRQLGLAVPLGAVAFAVALLAAWWANGRPNGAERDLLAFAGQGMGRLHRKLGALRPGRGRQLHQE